LVVLGYLCRHLIEARLTRSVQHEFDKKLAKFNNELQEEVKRLETLRSTGFSALLAQRNALAAKRIEAVQELWNGVLEARKGIGVAVNLEHMRIDAFVENANDPRIQLFLSTIGPKEIVSNEFILKLGSYSVHQPFVSPKAWALYLAYSTIITFSIAKIQTLQLGFDPVKFLKETHWTSLLEAALPPEDFKKIRTSPEYDLQWAMKRLEDAIVDELRHSMTAESAGLESVEGANRIQEAVDRLRAEEPVTRGYATKSTPESKQGSL
jgi:hypothetical protein